LIAVGDEHRRHLERSFFWRADMRRTFAAPAEMLAVARTLGPDVILVTSAGSPDVANTLAQIRQEAATRDSVIVILQGEGESAALVAPDDATVVLPADFDRADNDQPAPWHERVEALLSVRRRRDTRVVAEFDVEFWSGEGTARRQRRARALNLSSRGVLLTLPEAMEPSTRLEITFTAGSGLPQVSVVGEAVRVADTADHQWLAGIHFVVVRKDARLAIRDTLRALRPPSETADDGG
jgi:hypothetical protein